MEKIKLLLLIVAISFLCGCKQESTPVIQTNEVVIPELFVNNYGGGVDEAYETFSEFDENFITDIKINGDELILTLTQEQEDSLLADYVEHAQPQIDKFLEFNEKYSYEVSSDYKNVKIYLDENCPGITLTSVVGYIPFNTVLHLLLKEHNTDCLVNVEIYNCHTEKLIVEYNVPGDALIFGDEEFKASYQE